jgi:DNA repair exonuclease SbcCD ATPase subunit
MSFFQRGFDIARFKANQLSRINKLQNEIANLTGEIQGVRKQIADTTIHLHNSKAELPLNLRELCIRILELEGKISGIEQIISSIRAETYNPGIQTDLTSTTHELCPNCGQSVPDEAEYCIYCGQKIK